MQTLTSCLSNYRQLLSDVDHWFNLCLQAGGDTLACKMGCNACCRSLFDITLLDGWLLQQAFAQLPQTVRQRVLKRCEVRRYQLQQRWPKLESPFLLNGMPEEEWAITQEEDETPCPLLDENGLCLVYASRPLACRLHGLPNIDASGEDFEGTVCTLHNGDPLKLPEDVLRWRFKTVFVEEIEIFRAFCKSLTGTEYSELNTYIPLALLADYQAVDWVNLELSDARDQPDCAPS
ncbi:MAG: YkgJ family cysteine cluster protein [Desulfuromonadales bacterium]|nr:YkgJ family cysteine cluster protein [Desulfuromonadales bacterium]